MEALAKLTTIAYAGFSLLLGWFGAIVGFLFLVCGIAGAIIGQIIWSVACGIIAGARGRLDARVAQQADSGSAQAMRVE